MPVGFPIPDALQVLHRRLDTTGQRGDRVEYAPFPSHPRSAPTLVGSDPQVDPNLVDTSAEHTGVPPFPYQMFTKFLLFLAVYCGHRKELHMAPYLQPYLQV
jgi:hypothetical protein